MFPRFRKIELSELPDIFVNRIIMLTIIEELTNISKNNPLIVSDGMFTIKSKSNAKEAIKKAKRICQYCFKDKRERKKIEINKNVIVSPKLYPSDNPEMIVEKGIISKPEREGKLIPQIRKIRNKSLRFFKYQVSPVVASYLLRATNIFTRKFTSSSSESKKGSTNK